MNSPRRSLLATVAGYLVTAVAIIAVPVVFVPETSRSDLFWHRIAWTEFLAFLVWGFFGSFAAFAAGRERTGRGLGGVLPVVGFVVSGYAAASFALMMVAAYWTGGDSWSRIFTVLQILAAASAIVAVVLMYFVRTGAMAGAEPIPKGIKTPTDLSADLNYRRERLDVISDSNDELRRLQALLRTLAERLTYSLPGAGQVGYSRMYQDLASDVVALCAEVGAIEEHVGDSDKVRAMCGSAEELSHRVERVVQSLRR